MTDPHSTEYLDPQTGQTNLHASRLSNLGNQACAYITTSSTCFLLSLTFEGAALVMSNFLNSQVAGYVGWVGNLNPTTLVKLYVSNVTVGTLDENYAEFMSSYPIDFLKLTSRRAEESLVETLLNTPLFCTTSTTRTSIWPAKE